MNILFFRKCAARNRILDTLVKHIVNETKFGGGTQQTRIDWVAVADKAALACIAAAAVCMAVVGLLGGGVL